MKKLLLSLLLLGFASFCYASEPIGYYINKKMNLYAYYNCAGNKVSEIEDFVHEISNFQKGTLLIYCFKEKPSEPIMQTERTKIIEELENKKPAVRILFSMYELYNGEPHFIMLMNLFSPNTGKPLSAYRKDLKTNYFWQEEPLNYIDMYRWIQKQN